MEPLAGVRVFPELVQVAVSKSDVDVARARAGCIASLDMPPTASPSRAEHSESFPALQIDAPPLDDPDHAVSGTGAGGIAKGRSRPS